jgi:hypothetical protein
MIVLQLLGGFVYVANATAPNYGPVYEDVPASTSTTMVEHATTTMMEEVGTTEHAGSAEAVVSTVHEVSTVHMVETVPVHVTTTEHVTIHVTETVQQHVTMHVTVGYAPSLDSLRMK